MEKISLKPTGKSLWNIHMSRLGGEEGFELEIKHLGLLHVTLEWACSVNFRKSKINNQRMRGQFLIQNSSQNGNLVGRSRTEWQVIFLGCADLIYGFVAKHSLLALSIFKYLTHFCLT